MRCCVMPLWLQAHWCVCVQNNSKEANSGIANCHHQTITIVHALPNCIALAPSLFGRGTSHKHRRVKLSVCKRHFCSHMADIPVRGSL